MQSGCDSKEAAGGVPRLAPDCDPTALEISASEGFLLSRIDGQTSWKLLREIGGLTPDAVDRCLDDWLSRGFILIDEPKPDPPETADRPGPTPEALAEQAAASDSDGGIDESVLDEGLDLPLETQRRILEFEAGLGRSYHELLGVDRGMDGRDIKRAYFALSKEYHPDRYFRRNIGHFQQRLERIFKKGLEAYELLSDPTTRAEVERSMEAQPSSSPGSQAATTGVPVAQGAAPDRPLSPIERLRQRMPFRIPESIRAERRARANEFYKAGQISQRQGKYLEAASSVRLAIAFDPYNRVYKEAFGDVQAKAAEMRAAQLLESADSSLGSSELGEALRLYEDVLLYKPHDPEVNDKAANLALELDQIEKAREYIDRSIEHSPEVGRYHLTLAQVYRAQGDKGHAVHELEKAVGLEPSNEKARKLLTKLRRPRRGPAPGGTR